MSPRGTAVSSISTVHGGLRCSAGPSGARPPKRRQKTDRADRTRNTGGSRCMGGWARTATLMTLGALLGEEAQRAVAGICPTLGRNRQSWLERAGPRTQGRSYHTKDVCGSPRHPSLPPFRRRSVVQPRQSQLRPRLLPHVPRGQAGGRKGAPKGNGERTLELAMRHAASCLEGKRAIRRAIRRCRRIARRVPPSPGDSPGDFCHRRAAPPPAW